MGLFSKKQAAATVSTPGDKSTPTDTPSTNTPALSIASADHNGDAPDAKKEGRVTIIALLLGAISSMGGFMFGYESGQISGTSGHLCHSEQYANLSQASSRCPTSSPDLAITESSAPLVKEQSLVCCVLEHLLDVWLLPGFATNSVESTLFVLRHFRISSVS